jgi:hypothetical protein
MVYLLLRHAYLDSAHNVPAAARAAWSAWVPQTAAARGDALMAAVTEASYAESNAETGLLRSMNSQHRLDQDVLQCLHQVTSGCCVHCLSCYSSGKLLPLLILKS